MTRCPLCGSPAVHQERPFVENEAVERGMRAVIEVYPALSDETARALARAVLGLEETEAIRSDRPQA